ncbi:MAG: monooxygenase [Myxococcales bacterium]
MHPSHTVVIGAGPAGLAVSACLRQAGVPHDLLEQAGAVGSSWRRHYARLHLHTIKQLSALPGLPFPRDVPRYPSRAQVVDYLETYAERFGVAPRLGVRVERAWRDGDLWRVSTPGATFAGRHLVVATGYNRTPKQPEWPGQETFGGALLHSSAYRDGAPWRDRRVMVVGAGNSGAEIALDLWEHGARPLLCVRGPVRVVARDPLGIPAQVTSLALSRLPVRLADRIGASLTRRVTGDLSRWGLVEPEVGPVSQVRQLGRIPLIDVGTVALIKQGAIPVVPGIRAFLPDGVETVDGRRHLVDAVVLATGYRAALDGFLDGAAELCDDRGYPRWHGTQALAGLWFIGFSNPPTGALREVAIEARRIAAGIARAAR